MKGQSACTELSYPEEYISMEAVDIAFAKESDSAYLTDESKLEVINPTSDGKPNRQVGPKAEVWEVEGNRVAVASFGSLMGNVDPNGAFGFVGTASYLMLEGNLKYNSNNFVVATGDGVVFDVKDICVVPLSTDGQRCGDEVLASPGKYKFSLYGYADGASYEQYISGNKFLYMGFRQRVNVSHMGVNPQVAFNGGEFVPVSNIDMGATAVTSVKIRGRTTLAMSFPQTYNVGEVVMINNMPVPVPTMTKTIKIHAVQDTSSSFFVDYIFELADGLEKRLGYFAYDPEIQMDGGNATEQCVSLPRSLAEKLKARRCR